jgi:hypothetical protein
MDIFFVPTHMFFFTLLTAAIVLILQMIKKRVRFYS